MVENFNLNIVINKLLRNQRNKIKYHIFSKRYFDITFKCSINVLFCNMRNVGLREQVEKYYEYLGFYPESIHVDQIYRTKKNRKYCKEKGIRMSGPPLGRPKKNIEKKEKEQARKDEKIRNRIEGKFGEGKRKYGLDLIKGKRKDTSETKIAVTILVMNLMKRLREIIRGIDCQFLEKQRKKRIINNYRLLMKCLSSAKIIERTLVLLCM